MAIVRWRPFRDMLTIQDEMNRLFDDFFGRPPVRPEWTEDQWSPSVDVSETKDDIIIKAEMPGISKDDVKISIQDNVLTLKSEKRQEKEEKEANYHRVERSYGCFSRSFALPTAVKADKVKANYRDGVLNVTLPKTEEVKPKEIPVTVE
ncbi:MAG: Hsp20/alpha crystallin family protein [Candidatus Zixiibacteriota bacterium]